MGICRVVKNTLLPGFENGWLKYCALVHFWGWAAEHFEKDSQNLAEMFLHNSADANFD